LAVSPWPDRFDTFDPRAALGAIDIAALPNDLQHRLYILRRELALLAKHLPQLLKNALGQADVFLAPLDLQGVTAGDEPYVQRIADQPQVLVAAAEERHRFISVFKSQGYRSRSTHIGRKKLVLRKV
jgi:hypothetical protein